MSRSNIVAVFLLALLLCSSSQGHGRLVKVLKVPEEKTLLQKIPFFGRLMQEMTQMDYVDPGPNTNPKTGPLPPSPPAKP
ncbi:hypothetical protein HPP92_013044 [Vanilla planifolia]|uniref:Uncharacterized protein n=1 Tax=Vanilla planifolia TaxID=51239 RepID=A0A835QQZ2_VANPL|nr:hypothetical protein HPP92_013044 [Vanilla planifolia]